MPRSLPIKRLDVACLSGQRQVPRSRRDQAGWCLPGCSPRSASHRTERINAPHGLVPATSLVTAIILSARVGVLLRRAWARSIAALAALLTALTGAGLLFALPALAVLWSRASRMPPDVPDVADLREPPRAAATNRPYPRFTAATVLICVAAYVAELPGSSIGFLLIWGWPTATRGDAGGSEWSCHRARRAMAACYSRIPAWRPAALAAEHGRAYRCWSVRREAVWTRPLSVGVFRFPGGR